MFTAVTAHPVLGDFRQFRMATASVQDANQVFHLLLAKGSASAIANAPPKGEENHIERCFYDVFNDAL